MVQSATAASPVPDPASSHLVTDLVIAWLRRAFREYPVRVTMLMVLSVLTSVTDGLSISLLIPLLSTLFEGSNLMGDDQGPVAVALGRVADLAGRDNRLELIAGLIVGLVAVRAVLTYLDGQIMAWVSGQISQKMRSTIHENLLGVDFQFICVTDNGKLINTLDGETWRVTDMVFSVFGLFSNVCMILAFGGILLLISWQLTLLVAVLIGLISLLRRVIDRRSRLLGEQMVRAAESLSTRAYELLESMRMIRAFGRERSAQAGYQRASQRVFDITLQTTKLGGVTSSVQEVLYAAVVAILLLVAVQVGIGQASLIAFLALLHRVQPHIKAVDEARTELIHATGSAAAVTTLLDLPQWSAQATGTRTLPALEHAIRFEDVSFSYAGKAHEKRNALDHLSFEIPIGKTTALVGSSGAGKTTITNLLFRFHDPEEGRITVDGVPLNELDLGWWRSQLSISGQDTDLVSGTLAENIAYARPDATQAEIEEAARAADIHEFIVGLPKGYQTEIGERGVLLSGGQRQRIELARALLRNDGILILDEATNALDSMTEAEVFHAFETLRGQRTIVIIAHRLSTTRMADQVIVLSKGTIAEAGAPGDLFRSGGIFTKMVQLQELSYVINDADISAIPDDVKVAGRSG